MTAVLEAIGMEKRFPVKQQMLLRRRDTFQALQGIDLALYSGQTLGVVGESGSGKSTLGEIFGDLQQPTSGIVRYKRADIRSLGEKEYRLLSPQCAIYFPKSQRIHEPLLYCGENPCRAYEDPGGRL